MLDALNWLLATAEQWGALVALVSLLATALTWLWGRIRKIVQLLTSQAEIIGTLSNRVAGMIARQRDAFNDDPVPRFETDPLGQFEFANQALLDLLDWPLETLRGKGWEACVDGEDRPRAVKELEDAIDAKRFAIVLFRVVSRYGESFAVTCYVKPLVCEAHIVTGFTARFTKVQPAAASR